jgi:B12-binding domain/radical SAM domain protein
MPRVRVIIKFRKASRIPFNVLVGALESRITDSDLQVVVAYKPHQLEKYLSEVNPECTSVILWSFYSPQFVNIRAELTKLKKQYSAKKIIHLAGGVHASAEPLQTLQAGFDYVAVGEGEQIIVDFIRSLLNDVPVDSIKGIASLNENAQLKRNGRGELVALDDYPPFAPGHKLFGSIEITRGCIYACKFCQTPYISKARFRHRSIENIAHYAELMRCHGYRDYRFITPTSFSYGSEDETVNLDAMQTLLAAVRKAIGADARIFYGTFPSEVRPEHISHAALRILKKYVNNDNLIIGGQSGSQSILDQSKRGHNVEVISQAVRICRKEGFIPNVDFLFGLPGETNEDVKKTMALAQTLTDLGARIHSHTFMPLPGTPFQQSAAGSINKPTRIALTELEIQGKAYGKWKSQIQTARQLVELRQQSSRD